MEQGRIWEYYGSQTEIRKINRRNSAKNYSRREGRREEYGGRKDNRPIGRKEET